MCCQSTSLSFCCISTSYEFSLGEQLSCSHTSFFWKPAVIPNVFITSFFDPNLCFSSIVLKVVERVSNENLHKSPLSHLSSFEIKYYWSQNFKSEDRREISTEKLTSHNFKNHIRRWHRKCSSCAGPRGWGRGRPWAAPRSSCSRRGWTRATDLRPGRRSQSSRGNSSTSGRGWKLHRDSGPASRTRCALGKLKFHSFFFSL